MRILGFVIVLLASLNVFAGTLDVMKEGATASVGGEVRYFKLETEFGKPHLFLLNSYNQGCRIPVPLLKDLGIDPVQFGQTLRNVRGNDGVNVTCHMTEKEFGSHLFANRIEVTSWPRP